MPWCSAIGCSNSGKENFKVYRFPRDDKRRKEWAVRVKRVDSQGKLWIPGKYSSNVLCEVHFESSQFEPRRDDKRLKCNAVPTLFSHTKVSKPRESARNIHGKRKMIPDDHVPIEEKRICPDHKYGRVLIEEKQMCPDHANAIPESMKEMLQSKEDLSNICDEQKELLDEKTVENMLKEIEAKSSEIEKLKKSKTEIQKQLYVVKRKYELHKLQHSAFLNPDQIATLSRKSTRGVKWSNETVKTSLQLLFSCGTAGYNELISKKYPLPSVRTLQRHMSNLRVDSGILTDVFQYLKMKITSLNHFERDCSLTLDEMSLRPCYEFDSRNDKIVGDVTLPQHEGIATHSLVFMLSGLNKRWKQTVAFYFTGNSTNGEKLKDIIIDIIQHAEAIGLRVISITSDMSGVNRSMWKSFGISCTRAGSVTCDIEHPSDPDKRLYFLADVPHVLKNIRNAAITKSDILLPDETVIQNQLPTNIVNFKYVFELMEYDENHELKVAPNLTRTAILPDQYEKMKVSLALKVLNYDVSAGIQYMVQKELMQKDALTTAWFIKKVRRWFDLMSSRNPVFALSHFDHEKYCEAIDFLKDIILLFSKLTVGNNKQWKPWQAGLVLSTTAILKLQSILLNEEGYAFLLTSRFSQDCLENLFSSVRRRNSKPSPLQFIYSLRIITIAQTLKVPSNTNYDVDEGVFLADIIHTDKEATPKKTSMEEPLYSLLRSLQEDKEIQLNETDLSVLYYLGGYVVSKIKKTQFSCTACLDVVEGIAALADSSAEKLHDLLQIKEYKTGCLVHCTELVHKLLVKAEAVFRVYQDGSLMKNNSDIRKSLVEETLSQTLDMAFPQCHEIKKMVLTHFFNLRLYNLATKRTNMIKQKNCFSSKSFAKKLPL